MSSLRNIKPKNAPAPRAVYAPPQLEIDALTSIVCVNGESTEAFETLIAQMITRFQPVDAVEYMLVEELVASNWRIRRIWAVETALINAHSGLTANYTSPQARDGLKIAMINLSGSPAYLNGHKQEARLHNMYQRTLRTFALLRAIPGPPAAPPDSADEPAPFLLPA